MKKKLDTLFEQAINDLPDRVFDLGDRIAVINRGFNISRNVGDGRILLFDVTRFQYPVLGEGEIGLLLEKGFAIGTAILQKLKLEADLERLGLVKKKAMESNNDSKVRSLDRQRKKMLNKIESIEKYLHLKKKSTNFADHK